MPAKVKKVKWNCQQCGKQRWFIPAHARRRKFCSRACQYLALGGEQKSNEQKPKPTYGQRECEWCHSAFEAKSRHQRLCSQACSVRAAQERRKRQDVKERPCEECKKVFRPRPGGTGRFCSRPCLYASMRGEKAAHWRGGRYISKEGYAVTYAPNHHSAYGHGGYVKEHRLVMEQILGRALQPNENVHHINGKKDDNRPENLELWVRSQPAGQRAEDLVKWARNIIAQYGKLFPENT